MFAEDYNARLKMILPFVVSMRLSDIKNNIEHFWTWILFNAAIVLWELTEENANLKTKDADKRDENRKRVYKCLIVVCFSQLQCQVSGA